MTKSNLLKVLQFTPESDFYYDSEEVMKAIEEKESRQDVLKRVKALIAKGSMSEIDQISE